MTNVKWAVAGLFGLGLVAAVCAAVLAASWQSHGDGGAGSGGDVEVTAMVATRDLPAMSVVDASSVEARAVPASAAALDACVDAVQVVGKVLLVPVKAGQPLQRAQFATEGSSAQLAAALQQGDRAVCIELSDSMALEDLLYPGSIVDVLFSRVAHAENGVDQQPLSLTLLQGVRVLAVGDRTIVAPAGNPGPLGETRNGRPAVSLLVNGRQAQILKLAMQEGSVTLALRNPLDEASASVAATGVDALSPALSIARPRAPETEAAPGALAPLLPPKPWSTVVIKGGVATSQSFEQTASGGAP